MPFLTSGMILTSEVVSREVISGTAGKIYNSLSGISEFDLAHVNTLLEDLDLNKKIEIVESLFDNNRFDPTKKTFNIALNNLHEISEKISSELEEIKKNIEYTKTLYFRSLRTHKYIKHLDNLKKHSKILDNRLELVIKLSNMD
jgi:hypothetical protein|tara:strand:- start:54 stop:485 length:432 start_codon:yes stop_codon:yes gene_type:complete